MITITKKERCNGCHACYSACPVNFQSTDQSSNCLTMETDDEGFRYPVFDDEKCIKCGACVDVCPLLNEPYSSDLTPKAYACYNKDEAVRSESSSGGIFTLLANKILESGGGVFGAAWTDSFELEHSFITHKSELHKFRGSKYLQSRIGDSFTFILDFLNSGRRVLFSGTPCQIGGLRSFLDNKPINYDVNNLLCVDFICHGVPSPKVWAKYKNELESKFSSKLDSASFRNKEFGWKKFHLSFGFKNKSKQLKSLSSDKYMQAFLKDICLRPACHDCDFKTKHRLSDITMADFWGIQNVLPEMDDDKGTSLLMIHSKLGQSLFQGLSGSIVSQSVSFDDAIKYNPAMIKSSRPHPKRSEFMSKIDEFSFNKLYDCFLKPPFHKRVILFAKRLVKFVFRKLRIRK